MTHRNRVIPDLAGIKPTGPSPDVLWEWHQLAGHLTIEDQSGGLIAWIDQLLDGRTLGWWGDDWFAEALQLERLVRALLEQAAENGHAPLSPPLLSEDVMGFLDPVRSYFAALNWEPTQEELLDALAYWNRLVGKTTARHRATSLLQWLLNLSNGAVLGYWGDRRCELAIVEAIAHAFFFEIQRRGFIAPLIPDVETDGDGFIIVTSEYLAKIAPHIEQSCPALEAIKAKHCGWHG